MISENDVERPSAREFSMGQILNILPEGREYKLEDWKLCDRPMVSDDLQFEVEGRVNVRTKEETLLFLEEVYNSTGTSFNIQSGKPDRPGRGNRKCVMNVFHNKEKSKNLKRPELQRKCPATITYRLDQAKEILARDPPERVAKKTLERDFPLFFSFKMIHNHQTNRHEHSRFGTVSEETKRRFIELFDEGLTASAAWHAFRDEIVKNNPENYHILLGNRRVVPDYFWPHKFFSKWIEERLGSFEGVDGFKRLKHFVEEFDKRNQDIENLPEDQKYAAIEQTEDGQTVVVIIDRFMRRVHSMVPQAGDMLIMDATSNIDRSDTKLFHLMSPSAIGGLPLGTLVVTREDEKTIYHAMKLYQDNLPLNAFHGRGPKLGPALGMTDDCPAERNTLRRIWPELVALLCHFHILQVAMYFDYIDYIHHSPNPQKPKILQFKVEDRP